MEDRADGPKEEGLIQQSASPICLHQGGNEFGRLLGLMLWGPSATKKDMKSNRGLYLYPGVMLAPSSPCNQCDAFPKTWVGTQRAI